MSDIDLLETNVALTLTEVASVLRLLHQRGAHKGEPDRRLVVELVRAGKLRLVDDDQANHHWTVATSEVRRYLNGTKVRPDGTVAA